MGILLRDDLSRSFDRFKWSIYCRDGSYYYHGLDVRGESRAYHGKKLSIADGGEWDTTDMPDPIFCMWHWEQAMQAHARGFAVWHDLENMVSELQNQHLQLRTDTSNMSSPSRTRRVGARNRTRSRAQMRRGSRNEDQP